VRNVAVHKKGDRNLLGRVLKELAESEKNDNKQ